MFVANLRTLTGDNGDPWFVAKDVCDGLGIVNSRRGIAGLDDEKSVHLMNTSRGDKMVNIINDQLLFTLAKNLAVTKVNKSCNMLTISSSKGSSHQSGY